MNTLLRNWHLMRVLRAGIALWAFAEVWRTGEWILLALGSVFALQAIFDLGCGPAGCAPAPSKKFDAKDGKPTEEIVYEEVK